MTKKILLLLTFCFTALSLNAQDNIPDIKLKSADGEEVNIADFAKNGKITVFSFWATWCSPCKKELNNIADLYEDWQNDYNMEVVAISIDDARNAQKVKPYVDGQAWDYTVLLDVNEDLKRAFNFQTVPFTMILDQEGKIVYKHTGYVEGDEYELEEIVSAINEGTYEK